MNFKTTYILFAVLLVVLGVFAFALWYDPNARKEDTSRFVLPGLREGDDQPKPDSITKIEIERNEPKGEKIVLDRDPDTKRWKITAPRPLRADSLAVDGLVQQLLTATREENTDEPAKLSDWELDPPRRVITITKKDKTYRLNVGKTNSSGDLYVLDAYGSKKPMVVKLNRLSDVLKSFDDFRESELLANTPSEVRSVAIREGKDSVAWKKEGGQWQYTDPKDYGPAASAFEPPAPAGQPVKTPSGIETVLTDVANLKVERGDKSGDFLDDVKNFGDYGLDSKDSPLEITITKLDEAGKTIERTLLIGKKADDKGERYYARLAGDTTVVRVAAKDVEPLKKLLSDKGALRDRVLVQMDTAPSAVDIKNGSGLIQLRREAAVWKLWNDDTSEPVDQTVINGPNSLVNLLRQKNPPLIDSFIDRKEDTAKQDAALGFDNKAEVVELWSEGDGVKKEEEKGKKPELNSKKPTYHLTFGNPINERDKDLVYVKRETKRSDGNYETTIVLIPRLALDEAKKGPLAYLDKTLPRFAEKVSPGWEGVTKLVIQRGSKTLEVTRDKDDSPWKIVLPKEQAGRTADRAKIEEALAAMNRLTALRLAAPKANDGELDRDYGLKTPLAKVEITLKKDDKPVTYTYDFGKEPRPNSPEVYAKQSQRPMIFTVTRSVVDQLPTDFLDPVVFTFDFDKVQKVTLTGWKDLTDEGATVAFEKKDKKWEVVKGVAKDKFDAGKLTSLLDALHPCRALNFVEFKTGAKPAYKLDAASGALTIEIVIEGEKTPITLTVGGLDGDRGYYAMSNQSDGDVFLLPKGVFDGPKSKPKWFSQ